MKQIIRLTGVSQNDSRAHSHDLYIGENLGTQTFHVPRFIGGELRIYTSIADWDVMKGESAGSQEKTWNNSKIWKLVKKLVQTSKNQVPTL